MTREILGYLGLLLITVGVGLYSRPAGVIVGGVFLVVTAVFGLPDERKAEN
jgi:hypothetical protein